LIVATGRDPIGRFGRCKGTRLKGSVAAAIAREAEGVRKRPDAESLQTELGRLYRIWESVVELYAGNRTNARIFFNAPNRHLENKTPLALIKSGEFAPLDSLLAAMDLRQPA
jgi:uncharacterized protein (DUF2384 family)